MSGFGKRLRWLRQKVGMTQRELGEKVGTSDAMISYYESGRVVPSAERLEDLADVFGVSMDALWRGKRKKEAR